MVARCCARSGGRFDADEASPSREGACACPETTSEPNPPRGRGPASDAAASALPMLAVMCLATFVAAFNENIINVALVDIMGTFSVGAMTAQWLVTGYMIVTSIFTACITLGPACGPVVSGLTVTLFGWRAICSAPLAGHMFRAAGGRRDRRRLGRPAHAQRGRASQRPAQRALARPACRRAHGVRLLRGRAVRKPAVWRLRPGGRARTRRDVRAPAACARAAAARHPSHAELAVLAGVRASRGDDDDVVPHERAVAALLRGGLLA